MNTQNQHIGNFNEMVFENRNKTYGAYILRKGYRSNVSFSLLLSIAFFGLIALVALGFTKGNEPAFDKKVLIVTPDTMTWVEVELPRPLPKTLEPKKKVEIPKLHSDDQNLVASNEKPDKDVKPNETLVVTKLGTKDGKDTMPTTDVPPDVIEKKLPEEPKLPVLIASVMPEFYGNVFQYLADNLHYPRIAVENGTEGQVYLTFVVEKDGAIGDVKVLKPLGDGCTEEAIRVVKGMPKWKPGKNHDEPVRVQFNLPIKFRLK